MQSTSMTCSNFTWPSNLSYQKTLSRSDSGLRWLGWVFGDWTRWHNDLYMGAFEHFGSTSSLLLQRIWLICHRHTDIFHKTYWLLLMCSVVSSAALLLVCHASVGHGNIIVCPFPASSLCAAQAYFQSQDSRTDLSRDETCGVECGR